MGKEALAHHIRNIGMTLQGESDVGKIKQWAKQHTTHLSRMFGEESGEPIYPGLQTPDGRKQYAATLVEMAVAKSEGQLHVIPDFRPDGEPNFDELCDHCGNRCVDECRKSNLPFVIIGGH